MQITPKGLEVKGSLRMPIKRDIKCCKVNYHPSGKRRIPPMCLLISYFTLLLALTFSQTQITNCQKFQQANNNRNPDCAHYRQEYKTRAEQPQYQQAIRQQRQFSGSSSLQSPTTVITSAEGTGTGAKSSPLIDQPDSSPTNQSPQQQQLQVAALAPLVSSNQRNADTEHEEFSLQNSQNYSSNRLLQQINPQQETKQPDQQPQTPEIQHTTNRKLSAAQTNDAQEQPNSSTSNVLLETSTGESTTPTLPSADTVGSPVAPQPPLTTTPAASPSTTQSLSNEQLEQPQQQGISASTRVTSKDENHTSTELMLPEQQRHQDGQSASTVTIQLVQTQNQAQPQQPQPSQPQQYQSQPLAQPQVQVQSQSQPQVQVVNQHSPMMPTGRSEKSAEDPVLNGLYNAIDPLTGFPLDRMSGPPLVYSDGRLSSSLSVASAQTNASSNSTSGPSPRLFQSGGGGLQNSAAAVIAGGGPRRPSLPPAMNQANAASGFRSPMSPSGPLVGGPSGGQNQASMQNAMIQPPANSVLPPLSSGPNQGANFYQTAPPYAGSTSGNLFNSGLQLGNSNSMLNGGNLAYQQKPAYVLAQGINSQQSSLVGGGSNSLQQPLSGGSFLQSGQGSSGGLASYSGRRPLNITRVEHISAECSNDLIRAVIVFNGTFKGIIYSSGYVSDPTCLYVNGTGSTRYEFSIRLNQCGTLGRQELHQPTIPGEVRRRDQVMWNTLSIQYNSIIEQEWDEHFRVSCEYGSDFWKTVSFSPFNVETNTGSPVVFTINPPQCQMDVLLGHGMGPKIVDGPVTVGDPLTLLIHMKSEKAGYDILVKNCVAHNGGKQRMQLIDSNGCVVNERFISPFRGTYNDNDLRHVTLYAYLKAFRFTGSPVLYLECEIHMCQSACPPQMCYWRRLSKRSVSDLDYESSTNNSVAKTTSEQQPIISDSLNLFKALQVRHESEPTRQQRQSLQQVYAEDEEASLVCYRHAEVQIFLITVLSLLALVITIAITCCLRVRKLTKSQFEHSPLNSPSSCSLSGSLSPSLLSISEAISSASSMVSSCQPNLPGILSLHKNHCALASPWIQQHHDPKPQFPTRNQAKPKLPIKPAGPIYSQRKQIIQPSSTFHGDNRVPFICPNSQQQVQLNTR